MSQSIRITTPISSETIAKLRAGDTVALSGKILTGRDAAHKRMLELLDSGKHIPFDIKGQIIYYVGPTPAPPGRAIGAAGPTTSYRMDAYTPRLIEQGLKGMIGKGPRSQEVKDAMVKWKAIYFAAIGGTGALISQCIKEAEVVAWEELGAEAVRLLTIVDLPLIVATDSLGTDLYSEGPKEYRI